MTVAIIFGEKLNISAIIIIKNYKKRSTGSWKDFLKIFKPDTCGFGCVSICYSFFGLFYTAHKEK